METVKVKSMAAHNGEIEASMTHNEPSDNRQEPLLVLLVSGDGSK